MFERTDLRPDGKYDHPHTPDEYGDCQECDGGKWWEHPNGAA
jgi:hypothetical protein